MAASFLRKYMLENERNQVNLVSFQFWFEMKDNSENVTTFNSFSYKYKQRKGTDHLLKPNQAVYNSN